MKKIIFLLLLTPYLIYSQNNELFSGGMEISLTASQIDGDYNVGYHKISPSGGIYADLHLKKKISLRSGVYYAPKGARSGSRYTFFVTRFYYAEIPLLLNYKFNNKFSATIGLCFDYMFNGYYYDGVMKTDYQSLDLRTMDYAHYWSFNIHLSDRTALRFIQNYSLIPITKTISRSCWYDNMFFYWMFRNVPAQHCWWNNVVKISLEIKLF